ncbi:MAG: peptidase inhibitor family I36 protein [Rhodospirillales bacterium]
MTSLFNLFEAQVTLEGASNWNNPGFKVTGVVYGDIFGRLSDSLEMAAADLVNATEALVSGMNEEVHVFSQSLIQTRIDKDKVLDDIDAAGDTAKRELKKAENEVDKLNPSYKSAKKKCGWTRLDQCVKEGALWIALKTAKAILSLAEKAVTAAIEAAKLGAKAVLTALEASINTLGDAINTATAGLTSAFNAVGKVISFAANIVGDALEAIASVFEIQKLWMGGDLAALNDKLTGNLGIEVLILGKTYLHETDWNFNNPLEDVVSLVKGGSKEPTGKESYSTSTASATRTSESSQNIVKAMIEKATYNTPALPYNPRTCEVYPYILNEQIAEAEKNLSNLSNIAHTNLLSAYAAAFEQAPNNKYFEPKSCSVCFYKGSSYKGTSYCKSSNVSYVGKSFNDKMTSLRLNNAGCPKASVRIYEHSSHGGKSQSYTRSSGNVGKSWNDKMSGFKFSPGSSLLIGYKKPAYKALYMRTKMVLALPQDRSARDRKRVADELRSLLSSRNNNKSYVGSNAHREVYDIMVGLLNSTDKIQQQYRTPRSNAAAKTAKDNFNKLKRSQPKVRGPQDIAKLVAWQQKLAKAQVALGKALAAANKRSPLPIQIKVDGKYRNITPPYLAYQDENFLIKRKAELTDLLKSLYQIKKDPLSVCGQATKQAGVTETSCDKNKSKSAGAAKSIGIAKMTATMVKAVQAAEDAQIKRAATAKKKLQARRVAAVKKHQVKIKKSIAANTKSRASLQSKQLAQKVKLAGLAVKKQKARIAKLQRLIKRHPTAKELHKRMLARYKVITKKSRANKKKNVKRKKFKIPSVKDLAKNLNARKKRYEKDLKIAQANLKKAEAGLKSVKVKSKRLSISAKRRLAGKSWKKLSKTERTTLIKKRRLVAMPKKEHAKILRHLQARYGKSKSLRSLASKNNLKAAALVIRKVERPRKMQELLKKIKPQDKGAPRDTTFLGARLNAMRAGARSLSKK